mgnify:CR=1 FL=1
MPASVLLGERLLPLDTVNGTGFQLPAFCTQQVHAGVVNLQCLRLTDSRQPRNHVLQNRDGLLVPPQGRITVGKQALCP